MTALDIPRPNLFIVGAMKCATTSLHNYLDSHPEIFMTKDPWKEPSYFIKEKNLSKGISWYLNLFAKVSKENKIIGESSTDYTRSPHYLDVPDRIHAFNPHSRIIYIIRDPIERAISHYWWDVAYSAEGRDLLTVVKKVDWIINTSYYAFQIEPYIKLFGRENVYILTTESLASDAETCLRAIFNWLGVDGDFILPELQRHNKSRQVIHQFAGAKYISFLRGGFIWGALKRVIPHELRKFLLTRYTRTVERKDDLREETIRYLQPIMRAQTKELSSLLGGRKFPEWTTLNRDIGA